MGREGEIDKMASGDRNRSCVGQEERKRERERGRKVELVMTQEEIGHKQRLEFSERWSEIAGVEIRGSRRRTR